MFRKKSTAIFLFFILFVSFASLSSCRLNSKEDIEKEKLNSELRDITLDSYKNVKAIEDYLSNRGIEYNILTKDDYSGDYNEKMDANDRMLIAIYYKKKHKGFLPIIKETYYFIKLIIDEENKIKYAAFDESHLGI